MIYQEDDGTWWFLAHPCDDAYGPFKSQAQAESALREYSENEYLRPR